MESKSIRSQAIRRAIEACTQLGQWALCAFVVPADLQLAFSVITVRSKTAIHLLLLANTTKNAVYSEVISVLAIVANCRRQFLFSFSFSCELFVRHLGHIQLGGYYPLTAAVN